MRRIICSSIICYLSFLSYIFPVNLNQRDTLNILTDSLISNTSSTTQILLTQNFPLYDNSYIISSNKILKTNYRYIGDLITLSSVSNIYDLGFVGYPNVLSLYGNLFGLTAILKDGTQLDNRGTRNFNLNLIQTEEIDSIEIIPLPRGFLYSSFLKPASVNLITKDFIPAEPYSRIKYYQGPDREAFINGYFNAQIYKKLNFSFSITNRIKDETYRNSDFSIWQGNVKFNYSPSNKIRIIFLYDLNKYKSGFNGGVDYDSILSLTSNPNDILFDIIAAPVNFPQGYLNNSTHKPEIRIKSKIINWLASDLSIYYMLEKIETSTIKYSYIENKILGASFNNSIKFEPLNLGLIINYEKIRDYINEEIFSSGFITDFIKNHTLNEKINSDLLSFGGYLKINTLSQRISFSIFLKYSKLKQENNSNIIQLPSIQPVQKFSFNRLLKNSSYGVDLTTQISKNLSAYLGYAVVGKYLEIKHKNYLLFESSLNFKNDLIQANLKYFINEFEEFPYYNLIRHPISGVFIPHGNISGLCFNINIKYEFLELESISNYHWKLDSKEIYNIPEYLSKTGIYYNNILFNNNLDLKTGLSFNFIGNKIAYSEYSKHSKNYINKVNLMPVLTIDLNITGTIQKTATLYFITENIFDRKYFLIPYYPMSGRNIRFGIAWEFFN